MNWKSRLSPNRWAFLISGQGSTLSAGLSLLGEIDVRIVVSSKPGAAGLSRARRAAVATSILPAKINPKDWKDFTDSLLQRKVNSIFLLGFMKIVPAEFVQQWRGRILNVHPSLLPSYRGLHAMEKSHAERASMGVSIHEVTEGLDEGPLVLQKEVFAKGRSPQEFDQVRLHMAAAEQNLIRQALLNFRRSA